MIDVKEKNFISVVIYVHNNEKNIEGFLISINDIFAENFAKYEIICVNDCSTDETVSLIKNFAKTVKHAVVSIIRMGHYQGLELSMNAGIDLSIGDFVFEFDQVEIDYNLQTIMEVYQRSLKGFDIVNAAPKHVNQCSSKLFYALFNRFSANQYSLRTESFRVLSRRVINRVHSMSKTIPYRKALYANCGLKMDTIIYENRLIGRKNSGFANKRRDMAVDSLILFTDVAYKVSFFLSVFMMIASLLIGVYALTVFIERQPVVGWTTTMLFLAFGFSGIFGVLAIIIKYLAILVDLVFKKKSYTTESIEKLTI